MRIGVPTEIKADEYRVAITPAGVRELTSRGHEVLVQAGAGEGSAMDDEQFAAQGARIVADARRVFAEAELVLKVKEPQAEEVEMLRAGQTLFTYLHLAAEPELARGLMTRARPASPTRPSRTRDGRLPLLAPMSEVAGKIATQAGAFMLEKPLGGRGILLGGVPGRGGGDGARDRRRRGRHERGVHRDRHAGRRVRVRPLDRPPARTRSRLRGARLDGLLLDARDRGDAARAPTS